MEVEEQTASYGSPPSSNFSVPSTVAPPSPSSSAIPSPCHWSDAEAHDLADRIPLSEIEEIPSFRWLSPASRLISRGAGKREVMRAPSPPAGRRAETGLYWEGLTPPGSQQIMSRSLRPVEFSSSEERHLAVCNSGVLDHGGKEGLCQRQKKMVPIDRMNHVLHPHHKLKLECTEMPFKCDGCKEQGFHSHYTCEKSCNFHLHRDCAEPRHSLSHPFFKLCIFKFELERHHRVCDACGMDVKGFVYHCDPCGCDLHPCCANLQSVIQDGEHTLVLERRMSSKCYLCGMKKVEGLFTWGYVSKSKTYSLHIACVKELVLKSWMTHKSIGDNAEGSLLKMFIDSFFPRWFCSCCGCSASHIFYCNLSACCNDLNDG